MRPPVSSRGLMLMLFLAAVVMETVEPRSSRRSRGRKAECPVMKRPRNGRVAYRSRNRVATFKCNKNFILIGTGLSVCLKNREWSLPAPVCGGKNCPRLRFSKGLEVVKEYKGAKLRFKCPNGLTRQGPESILCIGKQWDGRPPKCLGRFTLTNITVSLKQSDAKERS
ncbi:CUB and sushi domain-containing protein 1 [Elysia marginata]|uniref:CUB and sushi domain-containing protein 1 n=1 Tax=Elysia marginata TaxID=1093978 RepID=A0AAV4GT94_9GAST|nr:CUB and sushi domain-containing protein 1 [Elysia marginata]